MIKTCWNLTRRIIDSPAGIRAGRLAIILLLETLAGQAKRFDFIDF
jgi:hypothetical protein